MTKKKDKLDLSGGSSLGQSPFDALSGAGLPPGSLPGPLHEAKPETKRHKSRGRVEIRREKSGRGGKTVTTASAFQGVCPQEQQDWVAQLRKKCGVGGTSRPGVIEIQGDRRDDLMRFFEEKGFRPVLAGG